MIGEVRSIIPEKINIMALTATATRSLRKSVKKTLGMKNTVVVELSPDKPNIFLSVEEVDGVKGAFLPVVERLKNLRTGMGRIIILCQTRDECPMLYSFFSYFALGKSLQSLLGCHHSFHSTV